MRFGRMEKRFNENTYSNMISLVEKLTGKEVSERDKNMIARGAGEIDLVRSGLEESMVLAYHQIREVKVNNPKVDSLRTAAFLSAINKISSDYMALGIFP